MSQRESKSNTASISIASINAEIESLEQQISKLKVQREKLLDDHNPTNNACSKQSDETSFLQLQLTSSDILRYSRQLLLNDGWGMKGQTRLKASKVLVVGAGGIGSSALLYLASSGVGTIGIVDHDDVELTNLHRQTIHCEGTVGMPKVYSAKKRLEGLNSAICVCAYHVQLTHENVLDIVERFDVVVDASDNPQTRYIINDACVLCDITLVSGSAIGTEGQLTVYNYSYNGNNDDDSTLCTTTRRSGCYRCLYPIRKAKASKSRGNNSNSADGCKSCSDNGVLGTVPGIIGILQATEVLKILTDNSTTSSTSDGSGGTIMHNRLLMYDSLRTSFMSIKKPPASAKCSVCGPNATIRSMQDSYESSSITRGPAGTSSSSAKPGLQPQHCDEESYKEISCMEYQRIRESGAQHVLLDVRVPRQYEMCSLDGSINLPLEQLLDEENLNTIEGKSNGELPIYCLCRRGVFSVAATKRMDEVIAEGRRKGIHSVYNVKGGLTAWSKEVDDSFPQY